MLLLFFSGPSTLGPSPLLLKECAQHVSTFLRPDSAGDAGQIVKGMRCQDVQEGHVRFNRPQTMIGGAVHEVRHAKGQTRRQA